MWHEDLSGAVTALDAIGAASEDDIRAALGDPATFERVVGGVRILDVNDRLLATLGGTREFHVRGIDERFATPEWVAAFVDALVGVWRGDHAGRSDIAIRNMDGDRLTGILEWFAPPGPAEVPDWSNVVITFTDTTERDQLARVVRMVSEAERALVMSATEEEMLAEVCRVAVEEGGYVMAWAGFAEDEAPHRIVPVAGSGYREVSLDEVDVRWDHSDLGGGPSGEAVRSGRPVVVADVASDPSFAPWRERAGAVGVAATASFPLLGEGLRGVLTVHSGRVGGFSSADVELLSRFAAILSTGIVSLRRQAVIEASRAALEGIVEEKDRFLATVAHELRTPLASVLGFAEMLVGEGSVPTSDVREFAGRIAGSAEELAGVVEDMLVAAHDGSDAITVVPEAVDLVGEVTSVLDRTGGRRATVRGEAGVHAFADPRRVRQVLRNLLSNAERYGGARVEVRIGEDEHGPWIVVADDGPQLDESIEERMFEAYVGTGGATPGPMGLGLFISRRLATAMGGALEFGRRDDWNCFRLSLPSMTRPGA